MRDFSIDLIWAKIQMAAAAVGGWLGYFLGGSDGLLIALIVFVTLDYVTGVMCAIIDKKLSSVDTNVVGSGSALRSAVICFYLSNEGLSVLENAAHIGLPVPDKLKDILAQLHGREDDKTDAGDTEDTEDTGK